MWMSLKEGHGKISKHGSHPVHSMSISNVCFQNRNAGHDKSNMRHTHPVISKQSETTEILAYSQKYRIIVTSGKDDACPQAALPSGSTIALPRLFLSKSLQLETRHCLDLLCHAGPPSANKTPRSEIMLNWLQASLGLISLITSLRISQLQYRRHDTCEDLSQVSIKLCLSYAGFIIYIISVNAHRLEWDEGQLCIS